MFRLYQFAQQLRGWKIDVLQVHFPDSTYFGVAAARLAGVRAIVRTRRDLFYWVTPAHRRWGRHIDHFYNRRFVHALVANSKSVRDQLLRDEHPAPARIEIIPNGVDVASFERVFGAEAPNFPRNKQSLTVAAVSMLRPEKRMDLLIRAARKVVDQHPNVRFAIAGEGRQRPELKTLIDELGLQQHVVLKGRISDVLGFLAGADIGVNCSDTEGLSNSVMECMAAGLPMVATAVGGNLELVRPGQNGLLVSPNQPHELADSISRLIQSPAERVRMGEAGGRFVRENFSMDAIADRYAKFYDSVVCA